MAIVQPRLLLLDTSHLNEYCADAMSDSPDRRDKARLFLGALDRLGFVLLITFEHVLEMLAHENDDEIEKRLQSLRGLRRIIWLRSQTVETDLGAITDVLRVEIAELQRNRSATLQGMVGLCRPKIFSFGAATDCRTLASNGLPELKAIARARQDSVTEIASLVHLDFGIELDEAIGKMASKMKMPKDLPATIEEQKRGVENQLRKRGDKRLKSPGQVSDQFYQTVTADMRSIASSCSTPIESICERFGLDSKIIKPTDTVREVCWLAAFNGLLGRGRFCSSKTTVAEVDPRRLPTQVIAHHLDIIRRTAQRAERGNLIDSHFASATCYVDATVVDRRTHEYIRQMRNKNAGLDSIMNTVLKAASYSGIIDQLASL